MGDTSRRRTGLAMLWLPLLVSTGLVVDFRLLFAGKVPAFLAWLLLPTLPLPLPTPSACLFLLFFLRGRTMCVSIQERSLEPNIVPLSLSLCLSLFQRKCET